MSLISPWRAVLCAAQRAKLRLSLRPTPGPTGRLFTARMTPAALGGPCLAETTLGLQPPAPIFDYRARGQLSGDHTDRPSGFSNQTDWPSVSGDQPAESAAAATNLPPSSVNRRMTSRRSTEPAGGVSGRACLVSQRCSYFSPLCSVVGPMARCVHARFAEARTLHKPVSHAAITARCFRKSAHTQLSLTV
ncbi:uncharacterized protein BJ171DRAFT_63225 [Polychytrium aggregatum]|uniref:uncharacterized protein n=1 Tax=Polychytrium aggregatum TaxID=110093 RepID=UPI0022FEA639|nr:uncharacterized protein BJ171DRAFT_63225 [Polychytrium aggregatum]KAI9205593.1 hypothetical protein BJ171DRAFT_63225 [Polychytrium aggregatum]